MKPIREVPVSNRPREKLKRMGAAALSDRDLIAAIIGKGIPGRDVYLVANEIAKVMKQNGSQLTCQDLIGIEGVGITKACQVIAGMELARRFLIKDIVKITSPQDVLPLVSHYIDKKQEYFICVTLNGAGEMIANRIITVGLLNHSPVHPREVYADAITDRAASVIFVHNHPSGNPEPSSQDVEITRQLVEAGSILGINVLDHIIVGKRGHVSLKERGLL
jgi:DNA repair protein RadC